MKPWTIFVTFATLTAFPLVFLVFHFSADQRLTWVSHLSLATLLLYGVIGGVRGFLLYVVGQEPFSWLKGVSQLRRRSKDSIERDSSSEHATKLGQITL